MTIHTRMLSSLAITAATLVTITFSCTEASAKSGGGGGMRSSFSRTPIAISRVRTVNTVSVASRKLSTVTTVRKSKTLVTNRNIATLNPKVSSRIKKTLIPVPPTGTPPVVTLPPKLPPVVTLPPVGIPPVVTLPPTLPPVVVPPPPVIIVDPIHPPKHHPTSVSVGIGAVAPVAVDPPGCTYERTVRHVPGVGLQRVLIKVCPEEVLP